MKIKNFLIDNTLNELNNPNMRYAERMIKKIIKITDEFTAQSEMFKDDNPSAASFHMQMNKALNQYIHFIKKVAEKMDKEFYGPVK